MYRYSAYAGNFHVVVCLSIDSIPQKHTVSLTGNTAYAGNFGLWQGSLKAGQNYTLIHHLKLLRMESMEQVDEQGYNHNPLLNF